MMYSLLNLRNLALIHGVETRTSSPVRVARDPKTLQAIGVGNMYPAGEGKYTFVVSMHCNSWPNSRQFAVFRRNNRCRIRWWYSFCCSRRISYC